MPAAKDQRPRAIETVGDGQRLAVNGPRREWQRQQHDSKHHQRQCSYARSRPTPSVTVSLRVTGSQEEEAQHRASSDDQELRQHSAGQEKRHGGNDGNGDACPVWRQSLAHSPQGECDHGHGGDLEAVEPAASVAAELVDAVGEGSQRRSGRQREAQPREEASKIPRAPRPNRDAELAAGRPGQELAQRNQLGESLLREPLPPRHVLVAEVADVRDGPAKGRQAKAQRDKQNFKQPRYIPIAAPLSPN